MGEDKVIKAARKLDAISGKAMQFPQLTEKKGARV